MGDNKKLFETEVAPVFLTSMADMNDEDKAFAKKVMALLEHMTPHVERFEATKRAHRDEFEAQLRAEAAEENKAQEKRHEAYVERLRRSFEREREHLQRQISAAGERAGVAPTELDGVHDPDLAVQHWRR